jgi:hypothetical protein
MIHAVQILAIQVSVITAGCVLQGNIKELGLTTTSVLRPYFVWQA